MKQLIDGQANKILVRVRQKTNLAPDKPPVTKARLWKAMVSMRLTTRQSSGPDGVVAQFHRACPFPLCHLKMLENKGEAEKFILDTIVKHKILRDRNNISGELAKNFHRLEEGEWNYALSRCNQLARPATRELEVEIANYIDTFIGFGPKQARNVLQVLGPDLDSRTGFRHREWQKCWRLINPGRKCGAKL